MATPLPAHLAAVDERARRAEAGVAAWFRRLAQDLRDSATVALIADAIRTGNTASLASALFAVAVPEPEFTPQMEREARAALQLVVDRQPPGRRIGLRFDVRDPGFEHAALSQGSRLVRDVPEQVRATLNRIVADAYRDGLHPHDFAPQIRATVGLTDRQAVAVMRYATRLTERGASTEFVQKASVRYADRLLRQRAILIARTETLRAANVSRISGFRQAASLGLVDRETARLVWVVAGDARVCAECQAMDGAEAPLSTGLFEGVQPPPPLHPDCLPGHSRVAAEAVAATSERWFDGELVVVRTAAGDQLSCTPNHPVLTPSGWMPARLLNVGSHVVCCRLGEGIGSRDLEHQHVPAAIDQVAEAFRRARGVTARPVPVAAEDFHGDGEGSEVAVVRADSLLRDRLDATLCKHHRELLFGMRRPDAESLATERQALALAGARCAAAAAGMGWRNLSGALLGSHAGPLHQFGSAAAADADATLEKPPPDDVAADAESISDRLLRLPGEIATDEVVHVERVPFHGVVYNLETPSGLYVAEGVVVHNCRCLTDLL